MKRTFIFMLTLTAAMSASAVQNEARLLRFPATNGSQIAFSYAGDLYVVPATGGIARKLTNDADGYEMFPRFSPDGSTIAFTAQYDGNTEVYAMPATGGEPRRLTYTATLGRDDVSDRMGPNNITLAWRDAEHIVFRSRMASFNDFKGKLYLASVHGGLPEELPLPAGGFCSYSPDGKKLAYNRVFREFRTWKYYKGGMADDIWLYDFATKQTERITDSENQDIFPMWAGSEIYFLSDRNRTMNLFCYNTETKATAQVTSFTDYDIKFPSLGGGAIVFEKGGYIFRYDIASKKCEQVPIRLNEDNIGGRARLVDVSRGISDVSLSPDGNRLAVKARGDIFTVPAKSGITRNLTETSGAHERDVMWSPDGRWIAYFSDETGEYELYIRSQDGLQPAIQLTRDSHTYPYRLLWSPDSKKILWSNRLQRLQYIDIATKKVTDVAQSAVGEIGGYVWSPDSRWIAYNLPRLNTTTVVMLYSTETKQQQPATDEWFESGVEAFSADGKYLFFSSARTFIPTYSHTEWNHAYTNMTKLYFVPLLKSTPSPFAYVNDEAKPVESAPQEAKKDDKKPAEAKPTADAQGVQVSIDFDGIAGRSLEIDAAAGRYSGVYSDGSTVYYNRGGSAYLYDLKKKKETEIGDVYLIDVTPDGKKALLRVPGGAYAITDLPRGKASIDETVSLADVKATVDFHAEWNQIFNECWRQMRDFFYDPNMHGVDWSSIRNKYSPLVAHVNNRNDLTYVIGEMIGELNCGHAYVGGGDKPAPRRISTGLLGAQIARADGGFYRIAKILQGRSWSAALRSPLTEAGVDAKVGDYITAINGKPTSAMSDLYAALIDKAGKQVELTLNAKPSAEGGRKVIVKPVADEAALYYFGWVQGNIDKVSRATNGEVGYLHIPDMSVAGLNEFVKYYYPQLNKKALIIDDRGNGGGNVSPMIIERLRRVAAMMGAGRNMLPYSKPDGMFIGPKVLLLDRYSASDGDLFPYQFKFFNLGPTVGVRSWGGVVGIRGTLPLIDGGTLNRPEFAHYSADGKQWIIEGHGVDPDYVVDNDPAKEYAGIDEQLNKAIDLAKEALKTNPGTYPQPPAYPVKN